MFGNGIAVPVSFYNHKGTWTNPFKYGDADFIGTDEENIQQSESAVFKISRPL